MAISVYTSQDEQYSVAQQSTWGTVITDGAAVTEAPAEPFDVVPGVNLRRPNRARGYRYPYAPDMSADTKGKEHIANIRMPAINQLFSILNYGIMQNVSESATSNDGWEKTFTWGSTQPDFSANAGKFYTIFKKMPVSSTSKKLGDAIIRNAVYSCKPGEGEESDLMMDLEFTGRKYEEDTDPDGTWTKPSYSSFNFASLATKTIAGTDVVIGDDGFSLTLNNNARPLGGTSDLFETYILGPYMGTFQIQVLWDSTIRTAMSNYRDGTVDEVILTWGSESSSGFLRWTLECIWDEAPLNSAQEGSFVTLTGTLGKTSGGSEPVTIEHADGVDRSF